MRGLALPGHTFRRLDQFPERHMSDFVPQQLQIHRNLSRRRENERLIPSLLMLMALEYGGLATRCRKEVRIDV